MGKQNGSASFSGGRNSMESGGGSPCVQYPLFGPGMGVKKRKSVHCGNITGENVQKNGTGIGEYDKSLMHS